MIRRLTATLALLALAFTGCGERAATPFAQHAPVMASPTPPRPAPGVSYAEELLVLQHDGFAPETENPLKDQVRPRGGQLAAKLQDREVPLPLKHTAVKAHCSLNLASVTLTQKYHNPYDSKIEAVYVFPLPADAAVRDFVLQIGERRIRGIVRERGEAEKIYLNARAQGHVATLLHQERPNIFTQSVANLEPGKEVDVHITYFHSARYEKGTFELAIPTVVGPRFNPAGYTDGVGAASPDKPGSSGQKIEVQYLAPNEVSSADLAIEADLNAGTEIATIESPTHLVDVARTGPGRAKVTLHANDRIPNKDFVLRWTVAGAGVRPSLALHRDGGEGYFTLMIHPPAELAEAPRPAREMIFVLDCSGSMHGEPLALAKRVMGRALRRLSPDDTFQVIRFSDSSSTWGAKPVPATPANVAKALRFVDGLNSEGGTNMIEGIKAALDFPHEAGRFRIVSFVTDGYIGNDREILGEIRKRLGPARVFSFGIGSSVNRYLVEGMGREGRGVSTVVTLNESGEKAVDALYERIERPALSDLRIDWGGLSESEVHPSPLPDLFVGRPVILSGRFKGTEKATVTIRGRAGAKDVAFQVDLDPARPGETNPAIAAVWARSKIASLHHAMWGGSDSRECGAEILATALKYGLASEFTSFVAVDSATKTAGESGTTVVQPVPVPAGVKYSTTVPR